MIAEQYKRVEIDKWKLFDMVGYGVHHDEVKRFHNSKARIKVCCAPRRTTKSYSAAHDVLDIILSPNSRTWVVGPSYSLAEKEFRYIHEALVLKRDKFGLPKPIKCNTSARSGQLFIEWGWGSVVEGKSADRPDSLLGDAIDAVIYSEAAQLPRAIRERYVQPTLITRKGMEIVPTTPQQGAEWVYDLFQIGQTGGNPDIESFSWNISANPTYDEAEFLKAKEFYGEDNPVFREQYLGEWVFYGGVVYSTFNPLLHEIEPFDIPPEWIRIRGLDFGHRDPFCCLWCAVGPQNELYFYREYYNRKGASIKEHAMKIKELSMDEKISLTVADPSEKQSLIDLGMEGVACIGANNDRANGRLKVLEYLMPTRDGKPPYNHIGTSRDRYPKMYFFNTLKETLNEIKFYRWREGKSVEGEREKTEGDDHAMDVMRYIVMTRPSVFRSQPGIGSNTFMGWFNRTKNDKFIGERIGADKVIHI